MNPLMRFEILCRRGNPQRRRTMETVIDLTTPTTCKHCEEYTPDGAVNPWGDCVVLEERGEEYVVNELSECECFKPI